MNAFSLIENLFGLVLFFSLGVLFSFVYYALLSFIESLKSIKKLLSEEKNKKRGLKSIYREYLEKKCEFSPIFLHIYDFFTVLLLSLVFAILSFCIYDGVIRLLSPLSVLFGYLISKGLVKRLEAGLFKVIFSPCAFFLFSLFCIKRYFIEKNNKKRRISEQNVSNFQ